MSFASHDLPDEHEDQSVASAGSPASLSAARPHARLCPFSSPPVGTDATREGGSAARFARCGVLGMTGILALCGAKCVLLYTVLPALAIGYAVSGPSASDPKEPQHDRKVPISCPFTGRHTEPVAKPDAGTRGHAALAPAQDPDPAPAR
jgi:hypothetical protein